MSVKEAKFTIGSINSSPEDGSLVDVDIGSQNSLINTGSQGGGSVPILNRQLRSISDYGRQSPRSRDNSLSEGDRKRRKPLHHSSIPTYSSDGGNLHHAVDAQDSATLNRVRYYQRLQPDPVIVPDHVLPPHIFSVFPTGVVTDAQGKQHSIITIFSIWNTMMGTSLLSMPWAIQQAGFVMGVVLLIVMAGLTLYTCYRVVKSVESAGKNGVLVEFSDVCKAYLGRWGEIVSVFFSLSALIGAMIVYWVLMSNFLYSTVTFCYDRIVGDDPTANITESSVVCVYTSNNTSLPPPSGSTTFDEVWDQTKTVPLFLCLLIFPLINFKSPTFFTKFNALGTLSVFFLLSYVCKMAAGWKINLNFTDTESPHYAEVFSWNFPALTGILALGYFIHNCVSSIIRNQKRPENNGRDLTIAYLLVALTYLFVGVMFYASFPLNKDCIADNLLDNLPHSDPLSFAARFFLLFQMITLFPLLVYITRVQLMDQLFGKAYPSVKHVLALNTCLVTISVLFAIFLPKIGTIIRFSGAFCGLAYIFTLPCLVYLLDQKRNGKLTPIKIVLHGFVILLGLVNFIAQFLLL
ncbi:neutral amino acid transporter 9-like [Amphiura filiformis]|uniref:neutral amino acid transporter 9-like n=1 Tax=Amphiura filiformis TaxID=82378 RepID=UPI003B2179A4